jgi:hypothetical protein
MTSFKDQALSQLTNAGNVAPDQLVEAQIFTTAACAYALLELGEAQRDATEFAKTQVIEMKEMQEDFIEALKQNLKDDGKL